MGMFKRSREAANAIASMPQEMDRSIAQPILTLAFAVVFLGLAILIASEK